MSTAAKVATHKRKSPHLYCYNPRCLWRVIRLDGRVTPCPKHGYKAGDRIRIRYGWCEGYEGTIVRVDTCAVIVHYDAPAIQDHAVQYDRLERLK